MNDNDKPKGGLIEELNELRQKVALLEKTLSQKEMHASEEVTSRLYKTNESVNLRKLAEQHLPAPPPIDLLELTREDIEHLFHELQVHQIELELQNDELLKNQQELEQSRDLLYDLYDLAPVGYLTVNKSGIIRKANLTLAAMLNADKQSLVGKPLSHFVHPEDQNLYFLKGRDLFRSPSLKQTEIRMLNSDGSFFHAMLTGRKTENTKEARLVVTDITPLKRTEEALKYAEKENKRAADIVANIGVGLHIYQLEDIDDDSSLRMITVNEAAAVMTGIPAGKTIGRTLDENFPELRRMEVPQKYAQVARSGISIELGEIHYSNEQIGFATFFVKVFPLPENCVGVSFENITKRKLLESQLHHSQRLDSLGTLAGGIAHEFNNILSIIRGYGDILLQKLPEDSTEKSYMENVHTASRRAVDLTKQILTFSRMEHQKNDVHYIQPLIKEVLKMMRATLPVTIEIQEDIDSNCAPILADPSQIHQVLVNLFTNAFHAMEETGGLLTVTLKQETHNGNQPLLSELKGDSFLKLTVSDTGYGIPIEDQEKIFDPFFTTKKVGEGTGLGLSMVHSIIKQHGGIITVESEMKTEQCSGGTSFHIYLPTASRSSESQQEEKKTLPRGRGHILVVDDDTLITEVYQDILTETGYDVTAFDNELDALKKFQQNPDQFDLIFTDFTMPHLTGDQLSQQILKIRPDIPIILTTGYSNMISEKKAKALGIQEFLMKPVEKIQLLETIQKLLKKNPENNHSNTIFS
ncbi:MAG: response regulator [SAR324 cluster bacterium]|nr:response regulator [SAR324 cluster bacterium]